MASRSWSFAGRICIAGGTLQLWIDRRQRDDASRRKRNGDVAGSLGHAVVGVPDECGGEAVADRVDQAPADEQAVVRVLGDQAISLVAAGLLALGAVPAEAELGQMNRTPRLRRQRRDLGGDS